MFLYNFTVNDSLLDQDAVSIGLVL